MDRSSEMNTKSFHVESANDRNSLAENFVVKHDRPFLLSMVNIAGPNDSELAYDSRFLITMVANKELDDKNVVFGEVVEGEDLVKEISSLGGETDGHPTKKINIDNCGVLA